MHFHADPVTEAVAIGVPVSRDEALGSRLIFGVLNTNVPMICSIFLSASASTTVGSTLGRIEVINAWYSLR